MFKRVIIPILLLFIFKGCTKDDICPEGEATTANMVITFNDIARPEMRKSVNVLSVLTNNIDSVKVQYLVKTDSIIVPLDTNSDTTKYLFIRSVISENDTISTYDELKFTYTRENGYVNRACGFKTEFTNLDAEFEVGNAGNWIEDINVNRETVNDETSAHVTLLH
ncbi:DUF6452 family protein [Aequorivita marina]|uniref:DUF6452 family protein n=1 Tax=Aequorivita marina TaxID=3073654 RepID=UPI0028759A94|nr:DUF6452 family protein [Aequorivita sp. S2608]MDS1299118.1 DUF6452 family protein [Aequorivita sp. S2608]